MISPEAVIKGLYNYLIFLFGSSPEGATTVSEEPAILRQARLDNG